MDQDGIIEYVTVTCPGINILRPTDGPGAGDTFFIYDPRRNLEPDQQIPFATIVTKDYGDFDNTSQLDRPDVFRLNVGVSRTTFDGAVDTRAQYDYAALDQLMPHPVYARQSWLCVLNPSPQTFERVKPLLAEAYTNAVSRLGQRRERSAG